MSPNKDVPDLYRRLLTECLHEIKYPGIYENLFAIYCHHVSKI